MQSTAQSSSRRPLSPTLPPRSPFQGPLQLGISGSLPQLAPQSGPGPGSPSRHSLRKSSSCGGIVYPERSERRKTPSKAEQAAASSYQTPFVEAYKQVAKQKNLRKLADLFAEADEDGSQEMSLSEFRSALRKPWIQRTFSTLGVQPHQSELVFKSMAKSELDELSFEQFLSGLQGVVGTDVDGTGTELNIENLRPTRAAKLQREMRHAAAESSHIPSSLEALRGRAPALPEVRLHKAFIDSAQAKALLPPSLSAKQTVVRRVAQK